MRVLYFSDNTSGHNQRFLEKLSQSELDVCFLDPTCERLPENWLPPGIRWVRPKHALVPNAGPDAFAQFLPEFQDLLKEIRPDLVHAGPTHTCGYVTALANFHPWLLMSWGSDILFHAGKCLDAGHATREALSHADGFFADSDAVRKAAKQFADFRDNPVVQFPWGIKKGSFAPAGDLPAQFKREPGTHVFICTRSWEPIYGIDVLLEAFRKANRTDSSLRLLLLGSGSQAGQIQQFISTHGLTGAVQIQGRIGKDDTPKWFRAADAYASCAQSDGTSVSLLEAMATGLPVVVTDIPSNREWVVEGHNGWLAPAGSSDEFADRLLRAARLTPEERNMFSERNQVLVSERADWDKNFAKLLDMYNRLVATAPK